MMIDEFATRTGYTPTFEEYAHIERQYYEFDGDKDAFCVEWKARHNNAVNAVMQKIHNQLVGEYLESGTATPEFIALKNIYFAISDDIKIAD